MSDRERPKYPNNRILPVINVHSEGRTIAIAGMVKEIGAGGVFLLDSKTSTKDKPEVLAKTARAVATAFPEFWVGVRCLCKETIGALDFFKDDIDSVCGVWQENALGWNTNQPVTLPNLHSLGVYGSLIRERADDTALLFGGLGENISDALVAATYVDYTQSYVDIVTATGSPERLNIIREAMDIGKLLATISEIDDPNLLAKSKIADFLLVTVVGGVGEWSDLHNFRKLHKAANNIQTTSSEELDELIAGA